MKKLFTGSVLLLLCHGLMAQTDSFRTVYLTAVNVKAAQKNAQQHLLKFYCANHSANTEDILARLPELSLTRRGCYGMEPTIRGLGGGQINLMIDGMRIHGACTDKMDPASIYIEPANLQSLQVHTTSTGIASGSSIGGAINLALPEPAFAGENSFSGQVYSSYQSAAKSKTVSAVINYAAKKWALRASGTYRKSNAYKSGDGSVISFSQFEKINYSFSAKYRLANDLILKADVLADDGWNIGYAALPMDVGYAAARIASLSVQQQNLRKKIYQWQVKVYANYIRHFMDDSKRPNIIMHMDMPGKSKTTGALADAEITTGRRHKILIKADAANTYLSASMTMYQPGQRPMYMLTWPDNEKMQAGISATSLFSIDSTWKLQTVLRADKVNYHLSSDIAKNHVIIFGSTGPKNFLLKNASAQLTKKISIPVSVGASLSYAERAPTATELYGFYLFNAGDGYDHIGNTSLNKETAMQCEIFANYTQGDTRLRITGFITGLGNYIGANINSNYSSMTVGANGVKTYQNTAHAFMGGFEAVFSAKAFTKFNVVSTLRYLYGKDEMNIPLPSITPFKNISSLRYQQKHFFAQVETEIAAAQNRVNTASGEDATAAWFVTHLRTGYDLVWKQSSIGIQAGVENIFNRSYHEHNDWGNVPRPGRNFYLLLKYAF